jgi:hypothetical protein
VDVIVIYEQPIRQVIFMYAADLAAIALVCSELPHLDWRDPIPAQIHCVTGARLAVHD